MKKILCLIAFVVYCTIHATAIPANGLPKTITQPDGTKVTIRLVGDEFAHYILSVDGLLLQEAKEGGYYYASMDGGRLTPTDILAHDPSHRNDMETKYVEKRIQEKTDSLLISTISQKHGELLMKANDNRTNGISRALGIPTRYVGRKKGLVILVNFANLAMASQTAHEDFDRMFNEEGYHDNGCVGSVHDYFYDQSYGTFNLTFDVVGPVTVSRNFGYYGSDFSETSHDASVREMVVEACQLADPYVDFRDYDWDDDGTVDQVFLVYAGYGQATGGPSNTIWPHESHISETLVLDGVNISQYACSNELYGYSEGNQMPMGIGCACHEFSHCLGLPDLYDRDYSGAFGMSYWDVMNSGSYNGPHGIGEVPCGYSAYERWFAGWLTFREISTSQKLPSILSIEESPVAYKIVNDGNANEFYTLENRQPDKWFQYTNEYEGLHGLLVTHIDYDLKSWMANNVNPNKKHQRMSPVVADNSYGKTYEEFAGDLFPGIRNVTELTNTSHADFGGTMFNRNTDGTFFMNKSLLNIQEKDGIISLDVVFNHELPAPVAGKPEDIAPNHFTAVWNDVEEAESYTLELQIIRSTIPFVTDTIIIDHIDAHEYTIDSIEGAYCKYRVRSCARNLHSEWSNTIAFSLPKPDGIEKVEMTDRTATPPYSLGGQKLMEPRKGTIYISNKKKYIKN